MGSPLTNNWLYTPDNPKIRSSLALVITLVVCGFTVVWVSKQPDRSQQAAFFSSVVEMLSVFMGLICDIETPSFRCLTTTSSRLAIA